MHTIEQMTNDELLDVARQAAWHTFSPYSKFPVGAAVLCDDGRVFPGCNIESASFSLTCGAERTAMFSAIASGYQGRLVRLAVSCPNGDVSMPNTLMPCGACRQVLREQLRPDAVVIVDAVGSFTLPELLPLAFQL